MSCADAGYHVQQLTSPEVVGGTFTSAERTSMLHVTTSDPPTELMMPQASLGPALHLILTATLTRTLTWTANLGPAKPLP